MLGTLLPPPFFTALDAAGVAIPGARLVFLLSGTSTPATVYTDAALTIPHQSVVTCDAAGRACIYLAPTSYRLQIHDAANVLIREIDPVTAVAPYNVDLDIPALAGENLALNDAVYLSGGDGGTTAGRWYRTDADSTYRSSLAPLVGMVPRAITAGATGTVRLSGRLTGLSGLTAGTPYYVSATPGAITATAPANVRMLGVADATTSLILFGGSTGASTGLSFVPLEAYGSDSAAVVATINASSEGIAIAASKITIGATTTFSSGYNPTDYLKKDGSNPAAGLLAAIGAANASTTTAALATKLATVDFDDAFFDANISVIDGGKIATGTLLASKIYADAITGWDISASTIDASDITGATITGTTSITGATVTFGAGAGVLNESAGITLTASTTPADLRAYSFTHGTKTGGLWGLFAGTETPSVGDWASNLHIISNAKSAGADEHYLYLQVGENVAFSAASSEGASRATQVAIAADVLSLSVGSLSIDGGSLTLGGHFLPDATANNRELGSSSALWKNIHLNLPSNQAPTYIVVNSAADASALGYLTGYNGDVTISGTTLRYRCGVVIAVNP